jgi:hypothetical protein
MEATRMNDPIRPAPNGNVAASVRATATDLEDIAGELEAGPPFRPSIAGKLTRLSAELTEAAAMLRAVPSGGAR